MPQITKSSYVALKQGMFSHEGTALLLGSQLEVRGGKKYKSYYNKLQQALLVASIDGKFYNEGN
jgi:hypothetical protein